MSISYILPSLVTFRHILLDGIVPLVFYSHTPIYTISNCLGPSPLAEIPLKMVVCREAKESSKPFRIRNASVFISAL